MQEYPLVSRLGVRVMDVMDCLIESKVNLNVTYDRRAGTCHMIGEYELADTKYLSLPPEVPPVVQLGTAIGEDNARVILEYFSNIVRFNNILLLRDEQYWREMEVIRKTQEELQLQGYAISPAARVGTIARRPRQYPAQRICRERRILCDDNSIIGESYREYSGKKSPIRCFWCRIDLACKIRECPLEIIASWERLTSEMEKGQALEFTSSQEDTKIEILEYLEVPQSEGTTSRKYCSYFEEELVGVHYPIRHQQESPSLDNFHTLADYDAVRTVPSKTDSNCTVSESGSEIYNLIVDVNVTIPQQGFDSEVYKLSFRDGNQSLHETVIKQTIL
ncbi:hypothetical protein C0J52_17178 [Blattella germanica]|nr:hypothetical protein C0J52_17178 [Blattella germanica]